MRLDGGGSGRRERTPRRGGTHTLEEVEREFGLEAHALIHHAATSRSASLPGSLAPPTPNPGGGAAWNADLWSARGPQARKARRAAKRVARRPPPPVTDRPATPRSLRPVPLRILRNLGVHQLLDPVGDALRRFAELPDGPVGGVVLGHDGVPGVVHQPLGERARQHELAFRHADEGVPEPVEPALRSRRPGNPPVQVVQLFHVAGGAGR